MATRHAETPELAPLHDDPMLALGGAPLPMVGPPADEHDKAARRWRKQEAKRRRDADRPPESFERFRILAELVNEGRQVVDIVDHKVRYGLVIISVLNAGVFFLMSRGHMFAGLSPGIKPWLVGFVVTYAALTFVFVLHAVDCLRPRRLKPTGAMPAFSGTEEASARRGPRGILFWETIAGCELAGYQRAWSEVRMDQLNAEVVVIAHQEARLIRAKYAALDRLYRGLAVLVVLAGLLLAVYAGFGLAE